MDQNIVSLFTAIIAVVGTLLGGIMVAIINSHTTGDQERKKIVRDKIEETYDMLDQTKKWAKLYISQFLAREKIIFSTKNDNILVDSDWLLEGVNDESKFSEIKDGRIDKSVIFPIKEIERNANLYIPSIKKDIKLLRASIDLIQLIIVKNGANILVYNINQLADDKEALAEFSKDDVNKVIKMSKDMTKKELIETAADHFEYHYKELQRSLERAMSKNWSR